MNTWIFLQKIFPVSLRSLSLRTHYAEADEDTDWPHTAQANSQLLSPPQKPHFFFFFQFVPGIACALQIAVVVRYFCILSSLKNHMLNLFGLKVWLRLLTYISMFLEWIVQKLFGCFLESAKEMIPYLKMYESPDGIQYACLLLGWYSWTGWDIPCKHH